MNEAVTYKNIWKIAFPIMVGGVAQNIVNVTDTAFLGQLSNVALGAAGNAGILYFVLVVTGMGFTTGSQIIIGRRNGEENYHQIGKVFQHSIYFMIPLGIILLTAIYFLAPELLSGITKSPYILKAAREYLTYRIFGIIFAFINFVFIAFYVGTTNTRILILSTLIMMLVNVFLDYSLIFGNFGFPALGVKGAAIASVMSEFATMLFFISFTVLKVDVLKYKLFEFAKIEYSIVTRILKVGSPIMLQNFLSLSSWFIFFMIIEKIGESELAISHIVRSIYMVLMIPLFGFSNATNTLVSNLIGQGKSDQVLSLIKKSMILALACTSIVLLFNISMSEYIVGLYTNDKSLYEGIDDTLQVINFTMFFFCIAFIMFNGVTGTGNTKTSLLIEFITISIYLVSTYYIAIVLESSLPIVWCSEFLYFGLLGIMSFVYLKWGNWKSVTI